MNTKDFLENRYAKVYYTEDRPNVLLCELLGAYIPEQSFKELVDLNRLNLTGNGLIVG